MKGIRIAQVSGLFILLGAPIYLPLLLFINPHFFDPIPEKPSPYPEKNIVIVIRARDNAAGITRTLESVYKQDYTNYRVIFVDDNSSDGTYNLAQQIIDKHRQQWRTTLIGNKSQRGLLANLYMTVHSCKDNEIVLTLDGNDWLPHPYVLSTIENIYTNPTIWLTFGRYRLFPTGQIGPTVFPPTESINLNKRSQQLNFSHAKSFYAWLFKSIKLENLLYADYFYQIISDDAVVLAMCEMAHAHTAYAQYVTCVHNSIGPKNGTISKNTLTLELEEHIKAQKPYEPMDKPHAIDKLAKNDTAAVIVYSQDNPEQLKNMLTSLKSHVKHQTKVHVLYLASAGKRKAYGALSRQFSDMIFTAITPATINSALLLRVNKMQDNYVIVTRDTEIITHDIDTATCINAMKKTGTDIFHVAFDYNSAKEFFLNSRLPLVDCQESICAWYPCNKKNDQTISCLAMTLWKKSRLLEALKNPKINSLTALDNELSSWLLATNTLGLLFETPRIETQVRTK